jgi:hypothetical protein
VLRETYGLRRNGNFLLGALLLAGVATLAYQLRSRPSRPAAREDAGPRGRDWKKGDYSPSVPVWLKIAYGVATPTIAGAYWRYYGPRNFLWLSDIALASTAASVIGEKRLLASMPAVGVLPLELAWNVDLLSGGKALGLAAYMFDRKIPAALRALSLFHVALPPTLLWMLSRLGYDRRAFAYQTGIAWTVLPLSYALTKPDENVNWVLGPGSKPQRAIPPLQYLIVEMAVLPALVFLPTHLILKRLFVTREAGRVGSFAQRTSRPGS